MPSVTVPVQGVVAPRSPKVSFSGNGAASAAWVEKKSRFWPFGPTSSDSGAITLLAKLSPFRVTVTSEMVPGWLVTKIFDGFGDAGPEMLLAGITIPLGLQYVHVVPFEVGVLVAASMRNVILPVLAAKTCDGSLSWFSRTPRSVAPGEY